MIDEKEVTKRTTVRLMRDEKEEEEEEEEERSQNQAKIPELTSVFQF